MKLIDTKISHFYCYIVVKPTTFSLLCYFQATLFLLLKSRSEILRKWTLRLNLKLKKLKGLQKNKKVDGINKIFSSKFEIGHEIFSHLVFLCQFFFFMVITLEIMALYVILFLYTKKALSLFHRWWFLSMSNPIVEAIDS